MMVFIPERTNFFLCHNLLGIFICGLKGYGNLESVFYKQSNNHCPEDISMSIGMKVVDL